MTSDRKEAADIARAVRRYLERERASGGADLLADGAERAARTPEGPRPIPSPPLPIEHHVATNLFGEPEPEPMSRTHAATSVLD